MKILHLIITCIAASFLLSGSTVQADTTNVFNFQKGNLTKDGVSYGSGAGYSGVLDGVLADANAAALLTTGQQAAVGNSFKSGSPNGQQNCGFFSYDLTDLNSFIIANTSISSTVTVASVSLTVLAGGTATTTGGNYALELYGTDPFTSSATWSNYNGSATWTVPYQNIGSSAQYGYTGGGSALTPILNTNTIFLNAATSGNPMTWLGGTNFMSAVTNAIGRADKTLYLTVRLPSTALFNSDSRQTLIFSPTNTVASRPQLQVKVVVVGTPPVSSDLKWVGNVNGTWDTSTLNWSDGVSAVTYANGKTVTFDDTLSTSPLNNNITLSSTFSPSNCIASNSAYDYSLTGGSLAGAMNLTKQGTGTFTLGMSNSYSGLTTISAGTLEIDNAGALGSTAGGTVVASGASLALSNGITLAGEPITINGTGSANNGALRTVDAVNSVTVAGPITVGSNAARIQTGIANGQLILTGPITDNGSNYLLNLNAGQANSILHVDTAGNTIISNVTLYSYLPPPSGGSIIFGVNDTFPSALVNFGGGLFDLNGTSQTFAGLGQGFLPQTGVVNNSSGTPSTLTIDYSGTTALSFQTPLSGNINVVKQGTGNQIFGGGNNVHHTYTGTTTVNGGILSLSSDMSGVTGTISVNSGGTLRGAATTSGIGGSVIINSGGIYYPGSASNNIGNSVILGSFTLNSGATMIATINPDLTISNSSVTVSGTTTYGGTLVVYSIGHTNALKAGETFQIFPGGGSGSFNNVVFNSIETQPGTTISFNGANGTVTVTGTTAPSLNVPVALGNGVMQINWSSSFYKLQSQTNALSTGLSNNWMDYASGNGLATVNVTNDPTIGCTFFRLAPKP